MNKPSITKNYLYKLLYEILLVVTPLITAPYVSRVLGADGIGIYSFTYSVMTYFTLVAALGTVAYGTREIARYRDDVYKSSKLFWEIELMTIITTGICCIAWIAVVYCFPDYRIYYLAFLPQLIGVAADISWFYTGHERIIYTVLWNSICKITGVILIFALVKTKSDLIVYILILTGTYCVGNMSMWIHLPFFLTKINFREIELKKHFKETLIYFIPAAATSIYTVLDKTLIGVITKDVYVNGYYEQATKIINMCKSLVFSSVNSVMNARMAYLFEKKRYPEIKRKMETAMSFILMLGYGCAVGVIAVSKRFVPVFFGPGYDPTASMLILMSPLIVIVGVSNCIGSQYYTPSGRRLQSARYIIIGAVENLLLNILLIPILGGYGAIIGSLTAELTIDALYIINCNGFISISFIWKASYKRLIAALIMLLAVLMIGSISLSNEIISLCVQVISGIIVYFLVLAVLKDELLSDMIQRLMKLK